MLIQILFVWQHATTQLMSTEGVSFSVSVLISPRNRTCMNIQSKFCDSLADHCHGVVQLRCFVYFRSSASRLTSARFVLCLLLLSMISLRYLHVRKYSQLIILLESRSLAQRHTLPRQESCINLYGPGGGTRTSHPSSCA